MNPTDQTGETDGGIVNRRRVLQGLGTLGAAGLAAGHPSVATAATRAGGDGDPVTQAEADWGNYSKTKLTDLDNGMQLEVTPDGRVLYITRGRYYEERYPDDPNRTAEIGVVDPDSGETTTALELPVFTAANDGGQGLVVDPDFEENGWVYVYYSPANEAIAESEEELASLNEAEEPPSEATGEPYNLLSRFTMEGDTIDPDSEVEILRVPVQRERCCHVGGGLEFDLDGNLLLSTGDDTDPFESSGYAPIDEREGRKYFDAQRSSANTADLRGKILRITPQDDGSYTIPEDNLFTEANGCGDEIEEGLARPEIYVMGLRNPFTITVDRGTGTPYYADYAPDSGEWSADRGPLGIVEIDRVDQAHNSGWPYDTGPNHPYLDYDFETGESGDPFDPENPVNDSPNNDGLEELPPSREPLIYYPAAWEPYLDAPDYADVPDEPPFPEVRGGGPMVGDVYRHRDGFGERALPESYDGTHLIMEFTQGWIKAVEYAEDGSVASIEPFMPDEEYVSPMNLEIAPDGALYLLEYGSFAGRGGGIYRLEHSGSGSDEPDES